LRGFAAPEPHSSLPPSIAALKVDAGPSPAHHHEESHGRLTRQQLMRENKIDGSSACGRNTLTYFTGIR